MEKNNKSKIKILVAMSGGVDSSVAALLLRKQGFAVSGVFLNLGQKKYKESLAGVKKVAKKINIPLKVFDLRKEFKREVINYFLKSYSTGFTPNPCIICNKQIKFGLLLKLAEKWGYDYLTSGHYARICPSVIARKIRPLGGDNEAISLLSRDCFAPLRGSRNDAVHLFVAKDEKKDQSYFLYNLTQKKLRKILFPLGNHKKEEIRKIADEAELPYLKKESQDICFLLCDHNEFLKKNLKLKKGQIITTERKIIGQHDGLPLYTIGQRRAIKIGGIGPFYVVRRDWRKNQLIVTNKFNDSILYSKELLAGDVNWLAGRVPQLPLKCKARIRYLHLLEDCLVSKKGKFYMVKFSRSQRAITPGQSVVFYKGKELLGGGVIK